MTKTPEGDPVASQEWPPRWCVVCDLLPCVPHVRDDGHTCEVPMRVNPSLSRAKIKRIRARFDAMRGKPDPSVLRGQEGPSSGREGKEPESESVAPSPPQGGTDE